MTRDEAIMVLNMVEAHGLAAEAKRMAIESLSADVVHKPDYSYEADMVRRLKDTLSADRPKGEWIDVEHEPYCECSVCGAYIENLDDDFAFCPRCGADMRPEK